MLNAAEITKIVDRMGEIKRQIAELNSESDTLEAMLLKQFEADVEDTKYKSVKYRGTESEVSAAYADSVKLIYPSMLKKIFGEAYRDVVTEETAYKLSANTKRLLAALYKKNFIGGTTVEEALSKITADGKTLKALLKKIKGKNFEGDKKNLMNIAGLDEETASDYAYMINEIAAWQEFEKLLSVSGEITKEKVDQTLDYINSAVVVEETPKITIT